MITDDHVVRTTFSMGLGEWPYKVQMIGITRSLNLLYVTANGVKKCNTPVSLSGNRQRQNRQSYLDAYLWCMSLLMRSSKIWPFVIDLYPGIVMKNFFFQMSYIFSFKLLKTSLLRTSTHPLRNATCTLLWQQHNPLPSRRAHVKPLTLIKVNINC